MAGPKPTAGPMTNDNRVIPFRKPRKAGRKCPICGAASQQATAPFCSRRCADVDLGRWLTGGYAIPTAEPGPDPNGEGGGEGEPG